MTNLLERKDLMSCINNFPPKQPTRAAKQAHYWYFLFDHLQTKARLHASQKVNAVKREKNNT
jgi:hypothetical protein